MHWGHRRAALLILLALLWAGSAQAVVRGQPLGQALDELRRAGLALIYSSSVISPGLAVTVDPGNGSVEEIARRILEPHGLSLEQIKPHLFAVVKRPPDPQTASSPAAPASARQAEAPQSIEEIDVYASRYAVDQAQTVPPSSTDVTRQDLEAMPGLFQDAMRAVRFLPGTATSAISARPHVRGGREDEVAVYFDGVQLFEPYHYKDVQALLGILDPETISSMDFFSGVFPAAYGNRLSGVLDMQPRTWNGGNYTAVSQSLLYSEALTLGKADSIPLQWLGAVRVGVVDFVADLLDRNQVEPKFLDAVGRMQYDLNDRITLAAGYLVLDDNVIADFNSSVAVPGGSLLASVERARIGYRDGTGWLGGTYALSAANRLRVVVSRTERHTHRVGALDRDGSADSSLDDGRHFGTTTVRLDDTAKLTDRLRWSGGVEVDEYMARYRYSSQARFDPNLAAAFNRTATLALRTDLNVGGQGYAAYTSVLWALRPDLALDAGVRWDAERYSLNYRGNQVSPRVSLQYQYDPRTVLRASWGRLSQTQRPDELQVTDGDNVFHRAEFAIQTVLSLERSLSPGVQVHVEAFDKLIADPRPRYENLFDPIALLPELEVDRALIHATSSRIDGAEVSMRWRAGEHWSGWANYTWSHATDVIDGQTVPRSWDQAHAAAIGAAWRTHPWLVSADLTWHTGWRRNRIHVVSIDPPVLDVTDLYARTWPAYLSLDSRLSWSHPLPRGSLELFGEIDNATNHANPCCTDVQFTGGTTPPLLERTTSVWLPRFALVGATWKFP
jgi:outer membrane receptor protein involved in Fe transport